MTIPTRAETLEATRKKGDRIAAVLPFHYPRELLRAFGFQPVEVWGPPNVSTEHGSIHLQAYACSIVRNAVSFLLQGGLDPADVLLVPHTCDALQGTASVLIDFVETKQPVLTVYLPRGQRSSDRSYLIDELRVLGKRLGELSSVSPSDEDLNEAIEREEQADAELAKLALNRAKVKLDDRSFFTVLRSREYLPAETFIEVAKAVPRGKPASSGVGLMVSGIVPEPMEVFDVINNAGGWVVADDLACCSRRLYPQSNETDPYARIADRLMRSPLGPTRGSPILERAEAIADRMKTTGAKGILVYDIMFCEPELFDLPQLRDYLSKLGFPLLHVEFDTMSSLSGQAVNRIEAFLEMLDEHP